MSAQASQSNQRNHTAPGSVAKSSPINPRTRSTRSGNSASTSCMHEPTFSADPLPSCMHEPTLSTKTLSSCMHEPTFRAKTLPSCMHEATLSAKTVSSCTKERSF